MRETVLRVSSARDHLSLGLELGLCFQREGEGLCHLESERACCQLEEEEGGEEGGVQFQALPLGVARGSVQAQDKNCLLPHLSLGLAR